MNFQYQDISIETVQAMIEEVSKQFLTREASLHIEEKGVSNFVTKADKAIEKAIKEKLLKTITL